MRAASEPPLDSLFPGGPWNRRDWGALGVLAVLCSVAMAAFLPPEQWGRSLPYADASHLTLFVVWVADQWWRNPAGLLDVPILAPMDNAFVDMDPVIVPGVLATPVWLLTKSFPAVFHWTVFLAAWTAAAACYLVLRRVWKVPRSAALAAAVAFSLNSDRWGHSIGHLNLLWTAVLPLAFWSGWALASRPGWRSALAVALAALASLWCSFYLLVLAFPAGLTGVLASLWARRDVPWRRLLLWAAVAALASLLVMLPTLLPYLGAGGEVSPYRGSLLEAKTFSATFKGWFLPPYRPGFHETVLGRYASRGTPPQSWPEDHQFLGYVFLALLLAEAVRLDLRWTRGRRWEAPERISALCLLGAFAAFVLSLGPVTEGGLLLPEYPLQALVFRPLHFFRVPARFAFLVQLLAAPPVAIFLGRVVLRRRTAGRGLCGLLIGAALLEHWPARPLPMRPVEGHPLIEALTDAGATRGASFVVLPDPGDLAFAPSLAAEWRPTMNGWDAAPTSRNYQAEMGLLEAEFPSTRTLALLVERKVHWIIVTDPALIHRSAECAWLAQAVSHARGAVFALQPHAIAMGEAWLQQASQRSAEHKAWRAENAPGAETVLVDFKAPVARFWPHLAELQAIEAEGVELTPTGVLTASLEIVLPEPMDPRLADALDIELTSARNLRGNPVRMTWAPRGEEHRILAPVYGTFESLGADRWVARFAVSDGFRWFEDAPAERFRLEFIDLPPWDNEPLMLREWRAVRNPTEEGR